jgi:drug/metabolite transporter (DMT)-like permease
MRSTNNPASNEGINAEWLVFDEAMTPTMIVGISIIIAAGLFILTRSNTAAAPN